MQIDDQFSFIRTFKYVRRDNDNPFFIKYFGRDYQKEKHQHIVQTPKNNFVKEKINEPVPQARFNQKNNKQQKYRQTQMKQIQELKNFAKVDMKKLKKQQRKQAQKAKKLIEKETPKKANKFQQKLKQQVNNKKNNNLLDLPELKLVNRRSKSIDIFQPREFTAFKKKQSTRQKEKNFKKTGKYIFDQYLDIEQIQQSRRNGQNKYFKGMIQFSERLKTFAKIKTLQVDGNLITEGRNKNRCIHEDEVYFEIIQQTPLKTLCKVVHIIQPQVKRHIVGRIDFLQFKRLYYITPNNQRFIAMNVRMNEIQRSWLKQINQKYFLVQFHSWKRDSQYPECTVISQFGKFGQIDIEADALLKTHNVYEKEYTQVQIEAGLKKFIDQADANGQYQISKQQIEERCDLRNQMIFTIDPLTARDFDDALSIKKITQDDLKRLNIRTRSQNEVYEIGVHIADASFFVQQNSVIDEQAKKRTTSVYLVHKVLPMLPRVLCQTMCSLNPGLQRLTLSVWFYIDIEGNILPGVRFDRTVIKSRARFTYQQAQLIIEGKINSQQQMEKGFGCTDEKYQKEIFHSIKVMNTIAMNLRKNRIQGGSLIFETPKKSFKLNQQHFPIQYQIKNRIESNFLVQEYMLLANKKVGQIFVEHLRPQALLRRHQFPGQKKISNFQAFMKKIGQPMKIQKHTKIQEQINKILTDPSIKMAIKEIIKHEMVYLLQMAEYFVVSEIPQKDWLHYALNMPVYTHFTSPIRRYPDIIVHRQLISVIQAKKENRPVVLNNQDILKSLVERCNKNKVSAKKVSTGCQKVFLCLYLKDKPVFTQAILVAVQQWGLKISIPKYDCRVMLKLKDLKNLKVLKCDKTQDDKKYMQVEVKDQESSMKLILKELQEIHVQLGSTETFPIDYQVSLCFPHPKKAGQKLIIK